MTKFSLIFLYKIKEIWKMEVFQTDNYYIFVKREKSLWWNRTTSEFSIKAGKFKVLSIWFFF